jgi:hypothetical protein
MVGKEKQVEEVSKKEKKSGGENPGFKEFGGVLNQVHFSNWGSGFVNPFFFCSSHHQCHQQDASSNT